jgi:hypothetical protein
MNEAMLIQVWFGILMSAWGLIVAGHKARHNLRNTPLTSPPTEGNKNGEASANISE